MEDFNKKKVLSDVQDVMSENGLNVKELKMSITQKRMPLPPNVMVFQTFAYLSATQLMPSSCKILMLFFSKLEYGNYIGMDLQTIADEIKMSKSAVEKGMRELKENNIVIQTKNFQDGRRLDYFLSPISSWKGNAYDRNKTIKKMKNEGSETSKQLDLFGFDNEEHIKRENQEIKNKIPTYHLQNTEENES